jgi:hypothetical protein
MPLKVKIPYQGFEFLPLSAEILESSHMPRTLEKVKEKLEMDESNKD